MEKTEVLAQFFMLVRTDVSNMSRIKSKQVEFFFKS